MYEPYGMPQNPMQLAQQLMGSYQQRVAPQQLIRVTGMDGAKAYQMGPNSCVPLFDSDNDIMYIKSTDGAQVPGATQVGAVAAGTPVSLSIDALVRNQCCDSASTLTLAITAATTPATVEVDNVAIVAERI